jgi:hypothetical protein
MRATVFDDTQAGVLVAAQCHLEKLELRELPRPPLRRLRRLGVKAPVGERNKVPELRALSAKP